ncbi:MAG TPA: sigma-54 dependent transcriptional regulator [Polyangiaceae bacterium]|nr:sigma-54 dependent transcriptional regulator [Polyangiaceae bacterium]
MIPLSTAAHILVVDDDANLGKFIIEILSDARYETDLVANGADAVKRLEAEAFDLVITDLRMPGMSGIELIQWAHAYDPRVVLLAVTAYGSIETAVRAVRSGASDYITKPFEPDTLLLAVEKCLHGRAMQLELARLRTEISRRYGFESLVAKSAVMQDIVGLAQRVADSPSTLLITGASGVGKEVLARAIHQSSKRRNRPFFAINCAAIPDNLLESELFGHKRGSFTGAVSDKPGLLQQAEGGTLLLDEIGDLPLALQVKILRVLQEREVRAVGSTRAEPIDVRLIAATHRDLKKGIELGTFREDLYYRLSVIELAIPGLADRPDDVLPLAQHFLDRANRTLGKHVREFAGAATRMLCAYAWPGNVRELENIVERAVNLCQGDVITPDDLPPALHRPREEDFLDRAAEQQWTIGQLETAYARRILARAGGNKKRTAAWLGIDRRTLRRWLGERESEPGDDSVPEAWTESKGSK